MKLTRRDALLALAAGGLVGSAGIKSDASIESEFSESDLEALVSIAEVLYPSAVEPSEEFVETFVVGRYQSDEERISGLKSALDDVLQTSRREVGKPFTESDIETRDDVLRATGGDRAHPDPDGTTAQQVRYYLINDLLYALYTTPKGSELVGNPNPPGYPGGTVAYQQGQSE